MSSVPFLRAALAARPRSLTVALLCALLGASLVAQRPGRGQRRPQPTQEAPQPPEKKPAPEQDEDEDLPRVAYRGGVVHIGDGRVLRRGTVLVRGSKIEKVGIDVELPEGTKVVDCSGKHLAPGFIALNANNLGLRGSPKNGEVADAIDPFDDSIARGLAVGLTSYLYASGSGSSAPAGESAVIKLLPGDLDGVVLRDNVIVSMRAPLSAGDRLKLEEAVTKAKEYLKARKDFEKQQEEGDKNAKAPELDKKLKPLLDVMRGDTRLRISSDGSVKGLRGALEICQMLGVPATLSGTTEAWIIADEIAATGSGCIVYARESQEPDATRSEPNGATVRNAKILSDAGIPVAVAVQPSRFGGASIGNDGILGQDLNTPFVDACFAVRGGLSDEEGLMTLTLGAAKLLGVEDRIGSLTEGKDADLLILSGDPLHYETFVDLAIVNGKLRYDRSKYPFYRKLGSR